MYAFSISLTNAQDININNPACDKITNKSEIKKYSDGDVWVVSIGATDKKKLMEILKNSGIKSSTGIKTFNDLAEGFASSESKTLGNLIKITNEKKADEADSLILRIKGERPKGDTLLLFWSCDGKKADTIRFIKIREENKPDQPTTSNWPATILCSAAPSYIFITKNMIAESEDDFTFGRYNCFVSKYKRKLPGEYFLIYDYRKGDYYALKKIVRKASSIKPNPCTVSGDKAKVEFYRIKRSAFFSPPVGSQLKVELMNYSDTLPLNLEVSYRDNFLDEESRFKSLLSTFGDNEGKAGQKKDASTTAPTNTSEAFNDSAKISRAQMDSLLVELDHELCYYLSHFNFNSLTAMLHEENLKTIEENIRSKFGIPPDKTIMIGLTNTFGEDATGKIYLKSIQSKFDRISNMQSILFTAFRVKNRDNVIIRFKDNKNQLRKEEELRISNGFKIDFSSGIFLTGLKDETFIFKDTTVSYTPSGSTARDTAGKYIIQENTSPRKIGFGILVHGYPRISSNYNVGITTGISINTNTEINVLAGLSLLLGSERRIVFSGGFIWGKANRLSNSVHEGFFRKDASTVSTPVFYATPNNVVPIVNDWYRSWFLGLTYNFTSGGH